MAVADADKGRLLLPTDGADLGKTAGVKAAAAGRVIGWLAIIWKMWQDGKAYDESYHIRQRAQRRRPRS